MREIDNFYLHANEPARSCLAAMRAIILQYDDEVTEAWRYSMPFFCFRGKRFCYLWVNRKTGLPYLGIVDGMKINHPRLVSENRSRMKIMTLDPAKDLPVRLIHKFIKQVVGV